ncbi:MAG TPA: AgmX/PglI C-terminal domain-containing protein [Polyangia bacterium]|jgi:hypothetical protein|nr:AgmX/PglI C-terminal domain-containing protein [Polyangia bacterium]
MSRAFSTFVLGAAFAACLAAAGCASDGAARRSAQARDDRPTHIAQATYGDDGASPEMTVEGEEGTLNQADVEGAINEHIAEIRQCYGLGKKSALRASGRLLLRFFVDGKGEVYDVGILESTIGNHAVERCIADIGLGVTFERPAGGKPTTFDYPVEFRPARQLSAERTRSR